jgi:hypothetical protein
VFVSFSNKCALISQQTLLLHTCDARKQVLTAQTLRTRACRLLGALRECYKSDKLLLAHVHDSRVDIKAQSNTYSTVRDVTNEALCSYRKHCKGHIICIGTFCARNHKVQIVLCVVSTLVLSVIGRMRRRRVLTNRCNVVSHTERHVKALVDEKTVFCREECVSE